MKATDAQLRAALDRPPPDIRLFLLHGPDEAAAMDHAARLGRAMGAGAERVDLDSATLKSDSTRLADEAASLSLFGGARWIRITGATDDALASVAALLDAPRAGSPVLAIGPSLRKTSKLLKLALDSRAALAFACWVPDGAKADGLAAALAREHGLRPVGRTAHRLAEASGGDRAIMAREIEKLALYLDAAPDRPRDLDDAALDAIGADLGDGEAGAAVDALIEGRLADLGAELARLAESGASPVAWLRQLGTRLKLMAEIKLEAERGGDLATALNRRGFRYEREKRLAAALRRWTPVMLARGIETVAAAERTEKSSMTAGAVLAAVAALDLARGLEQRR